MDRQELIDRASRARAAAHAPYSGYPVGAALVTDDGAVFTGCNVENASYGLTVCAERVALFHAVRAGHRKVVAMAVVTDQGASCCGACRQVLAEFADDDCLVHLAAADGRSRTVTLGGLLPEAFRAGDLP